MSNQTTIYPVAFVPNPNTECRLYYVGFPKNWKDRLVKAEKLSNPKWSGVYALPTYALGKSLASWMDGIVELTPLRMDSNDEMWAISCEQEIDTEQLLDHIKIWIQTQYRSNRKYQRAETEIQELLQEMSAVELKNLAGSKTARLFDEDGIPTENYSYKAFSLMVTNALTGKEIQIDGHPVKLNYAGKDHLISDIQGEAERSYSYGITFSLQTVPPERKSLLLCDCCIHRWIPGRWSEKPPYLKGENVLAHIWMKNDRIYKIPIFQKYNTEEAYFWKEPEKAYYNLYQFRSLPAAKDVIASMDDWLFGEQPITCLYKNGMDGCGFKKNVIGTGVSVSEKKDIYDGVYSYIMDMVQKVQGVSRIRRTRNAAQKLKLDTINFNRELTEEQRLFLARRMKACTESDHITFEVYAAENHVNCAEKIMEKLEQVFQTGAEMAFSIKLCGLGSMGDALESSDPAAVLKRIHEIEQKLAPAAELTACIVVLPGKDDFTEGDPKKAIRCGMALRNRLTQFIMPWKEDAEDCVADNKITSAIEDLCRQLGYIRGLEEAVEENEQLLVHTPVIGTHIMTQVRTLYGKARFLPLYVEMDYVSGKVFVECDAFEQTRVPYREAAFEMARLSLDRNFEKKCENAARGTWKQKMIMWKNLYRDRNLLVLIEANGNTRSVCNGITDGQIQKYTYLAPYRPEELDVGAKDSRYLLNLNDSGVRLIRIRRNGEVPDYYTALSKKEGYSAASGVFRYGKDYWAIATRPNDKSYCLSYKRTTYDMPQQKFSERDMIEIYPIQLQKEDNPDEWVIYTNSLRTGAIQYDEATSLPIPLHMAAKLQEYLLEV